MHQREGRVAFHNNKFSRPGRPIIYFHSFSGDPADKIGGIMLYNLGISVIDHYELYDSKIQKSESVYGDIRTFEHRYTCNRRQPPDRQMDHQQILEKYCLALIIRRFCSNSY